jgi:hypothetical protein
VGKTAIVRIGDWCLFETLPGNTREYLFLLGRVLQFQFLSGNKQKQIYEWQIGIDKKADKDIGFNCTWYKFDDQTNGLKKCPQLEQSWLFLFMLFILSIAISAVSLHQQSLRVIKLCIPKTL